MATRQTIPSGRKPSGRYVVCIDNAGYPASLETRKIYRTLPDTQASAQGLLRVLDESGEDYLYPSELFVPIRLTQDLKTAMHLAA